MKKAMAPSSFFWIFSGLSALSIGQPVLDLLGRNSQFLVLHHHGPIEIIFLALALCFGPAIVFGALAWVIGRFNSRMAQFVLACSATLLFSLTLIPLVGKLGIIPDMVVLLASLALATLTTWKLGSNKSLRSYLSLLGIIPVIVIGIFLSQPGLRLIFFPPHTESIATEDNQLQPNSNTPVVMVVFDAFPTVSLMNNDEAIDTSLCPNLAEFAKDAVWYKNALTVSDNTLLAVPAILTGCLPLAESQPNKTWFPDNLFSWLAQWRPVYPEESGTQLSSSKPKPTFSERWRVTSSDLWVIFLHTVLPDGYSQNLPSITNNWINFAGQESIEDDYIAHTGRDILFSNFLHSLEIGAPNGCYYLHSLVPHTPYQFLPSGRLYSRKGREPSGQGLQWGKWSSDIQAVIHSRQRHLLQVGYTDFQVGLIVDKLKEVGLYENSIVIFTADHGMSFTPEDGRRQMTATNRGDILPVPLFIKYPGTGNGSTDERVIQTVDILPTIAAALETELPWSAFGQNLLSDSYQGIATTVFIESDIKKERIEIPVDEVILQRKSSIQTKEQQFARINNKLTLTTSLRGHHLIGQPVPADLPQSSQWVISLAGDPLRTVSPSSGALVPAEVFGLISDKKPLPENYDIAVTVDGKIGALCRPFVRTDKRKTSTWSSLLTDDFLTPGEHELGLLLVDWINAKPQLYSLKQNQASILNLNLLTHDLFITKLSGLFTMGNWNGTPTVWSNGAASFQLLISETRNPRFLELSASAADPEGAYIAVCADGKLVGAGFVNKFPWTGMADLQNVKINSELSLNIFSTTHVPANINPQSQDTRSLGLALTNVKLKNDLQVGLSEESSPYILPNPFHLTLNPAFAGNTQWTGVEKSSDWGGQLATWTNDLATCQLNWPRPVSPRYLLVDLAGTSPKGTHFTISIDGIEVLSNELVQNDWQKLINLSNVPISGPCELTLSSSTFIPSQLSSESSDHRVLGVALRQIILIE